MLNLQENTPLNMLRQFAEYLDGDLEETFGAAKLSLDNASGKGQIGLYQLTKGLTAWIYNITFNQELPITATWAEDKPYYFGYILSGYQLQKFPDEDDYKEIRRNQNFIIISKPGAQSQFLIPSNVEFQCCYLIINPTELKSHVSPNRTRLVRDLQDTFSIYTGDETYRYFGNIDARMGTYADVIIQNLRTDVVGRLNKEGAVLNLLAAQIESHDLDKSTDSFKIDVSRKELQRILSLGDYILDHISEKITIQDMSDHLEMSVKKVQAGVKFAFGSTANEYLSKLRIEHAKELMHKTDMSVSEICFSVGYQSRSYFSKVFQDYTGYLPSEYMQIAEDENLIFEVTYRSIASSTLSETDFDDIISMSRKANKKYNVTGSIVFHDNVFFQLIEGSKENILRLYDNIRKDKRHKNVKTLWKGYKVKRDFKNWAMATITDKNNLKIKIDGQSQKLNLGNDLESIKDTQMATDKLWRKVRNLIKLSSQRISPEVK